jgi:cytochrome c-type biogenesis protein
VDTQSLTLPLAFVAGLLSFASPCVLPLVPAYVGYLGGTAVIGGGQVDVRGETWRTFSHSLFFVLGFMAIFVLLGASATFVGQLLLDYSVLLQRVGGVLLVIFGMRMMAVGWGRQRWIGAAVVVGLATLLLSNSLPLERLEEGLVMVAVVLAGAGFIQPVQIGLAGLAGVLNYLSSYDALVPNLVASVLVSLMAVFLNRSDLFYAEKKIELRQTNQSGYLRSLLFGVVFAAGWTPCVGPILAGILILAGTLGTVGQGVMMLVVYSLGLGIPFLLVGLAFGPLSAWLRKMNRYLGVVSIVSGVLLVLMGILIFTDSLGFLAQYSGFFEPSL